MDITDRQIEYLNELPASSFSEWADSLDVDKTAAVRVAQRIDASDVDITIEKVDGQYRPVGNLDALADTHFEGLEGGVNASKTGDLEDETVEETPADDVDPDDPPAGLRRDLEREGLTYRDLKNEYGLAKGSAERLIDGLQSRGWAIEFERIDAQGTRLFKLADERNKQFRVGDGDGTYTFGLISDTHLGSQADHVDELHDFYDRLVDRGISTVFHAGDITDGYEVYRHHVNELHPEAIGWGRLREYCREKYPRREGITTHFITGNHDYKYYKRNGVHFGSLIDSDREDLNWLGEMSATLVFDADAGVDLELIHPSGGTPYTVGYRAQTLYRERPPDDRPTLAGIGHLHDKMQANAEGVEAFYTGSWQGPTPYIKRKGLPTKIGGWIVELDLDGGEVRRMRTEWIGYEPRGESNEYDVSELTEL